MVLNNRYEITAVKPSVISGLIVGSLVENAYNQKQLERYQGFGCVIYGKKNNIIAGSTAVFYYGCFYIENLWVVETHRNMGLGSKVINYWEHIAANNKANMITVTTMDWEAKPFYEQNGFYVEFAREGYYKDSTRYFLRKDLKIV
jgi:ribosomal protein S18 acetylase RimI-like enzyme